ncbi:MAG: UDP-N-acetylmuramoyl-L-alanine--D-glutamate ligase, partial [Chloroflexota bacterium]
MEWRDKRVLVIGAARQGKILASYLSNQGARVVLTDQRDADTLVRVIDDLSQYDIEWRFGGHSMDLLEGVDAICPSGGVPLDIPIVAEAINRKILLTNDSQIFLEQVDCSVVGITGSAGKTTTTSLVGAIAKATINAHSHSPYRQVWVGGNIGLPLLTELENMNAEDIAVMELSSFQLEIMKKSPDIACVLNITPNHLDRHKHMAAYSEVKANILRYQTKDDIAVLNRDDEIVWGLDKLTPGKIISFGMDEIAEGHLGTFVRDGAVWLRFDEGELEILPIDQIPLLGKHNLYNVLAACAISLAAGLSVVAMREAIGKFDGIPHRLEFVRSWGSADWYNDSIATAPERSIAAMKSFDQPIVLLAGGQDKDLHWDEFANEVHNRVDHLILFGEAAELIASAIKITTADERPYTITKCNQLTEAIQAASKLVEPGDVVLLSPGGTSYDEFSDFEDRGN